MKVVEDVSKLTTIPQQEVQCVVNAIKDCICYALQESIKNKEDYADIDIGIGALCLNITEDGVEYKFVPSKDLENDIIYTAQHDCCPLVHKIEESIRNKIVGAYKEFF